jgi:hypothetical protein
MRLGSWLGLAGLLLVGPAWSQELNFRAVAPRPSAPTTSDIVTIGPIRGASQIAPSPPSSAIVPVSASTTTTSCVFPMMPGTIVRGQAPDPFGPPPPPPFPGGFPGNPPPPPGSGPVGGRPKPNEEAYNCGRINSDADQGTFFERTGDSFRRCWLDISEGVRGGFTGDSNRAAFQTPHCFDYIISPVTNPSYFEDPRALTEFRPIFMWQSTNSANPVFGGRDNYVLNLQGRVAVTQNISIVVQRFGWYFDDVAVPAGGLSSSNGFSELHIGPKLTFADDTLKRVWALGLTFEVPIGSSKVGQDTGDLSLRPYFSFAQNFGRTDYGGFNFMNTTGYSLPIDDQRSHQFFSSFHLDYDIADQHKYYALVEFNWMYYPFNGGLRPFPFEGNNLYNFGSLGAGGRNDMSVAIGGRYKYSENLQFGLAAEFNVLGNSANHMDDFRLTLDMILRY